VDAQDARTPEEKLADDVKNLYLDRLAAADVRARDCGRPRSSHFVFDELLLGRHTSAPNMLFALFLVPGCWVRQGDAFAALLREVEARYSGAQRLAQIKLHYADKVASKRLENSTSIRAAADAVIATINTAELAAHFGTLVRQYAPRRLDPVPVCNTS
jgi:hypothetical protein